MKTITPLLSLIFAALICGCASTYTPHSVDLNQLETFYVQTSPEDEHQVDQLLSEQLILLGFKSSYGPAAETPGEIDAIVTYQDQWDWDVTPYMLELKVQILQASDGLMIANGRAYRPSPQRKSPRNMAREVLTKIFIEAESVQSAY